jgi:hypothetical protein
MKIILPGRFADHRRFISEELPRLIYQIHMDSKLGGKFVRTTFKIDERMDSLGLLSKVIQDAPTVFETAVYLGKTSRSFWAGNRRIGLKAWAENEQTVIELRSVNKGQTAVVLGLLLCVLPGVLALIAQSMNASFEHGVMKKVWAEVKVRFPNAAMQEA